MKIITTVYDPTTFYINGNKVRAIAHEHDVFLFVSDVSKMIGKNIQSEYKEEIRTRRLEKRSFDNCIGLFTNDECNNEFVMENGTLQSLLKAVGQPDVAITLREMTPTIHSDVDRTDGSLNYGRRNRLAKIIEKYFPDNCQDVTDFLVEHFNVKITNYFESLPNHLFYEAIKVIHALRIENGKVIIPSGA